MMQLLTVQVATLSILWSRFLTYQLAILLTSSSLSVSGICSAADKNMSFYILSIKTCLFLFYQLLPMMQLLTVQVATLSILWSRFLTYQLAILLTSSSLSVSGICSAADKNMSFFILSTLADDATPHSPSGHSVNSLVQILNIPIGNSSDQQ